MLVPMSRDDKWCTRSDRVVRGLYAMHDTFVLCNDQRAVEYSISDAVRDAASGTRCLRGVDAAYGPFCLHSAKHSRLPTPTGLTYSHGHIGHGHRHRPITLSPLASVRRPFVRIICTIKLKGSIARASYSTRRSPPITSARLPCHRIDVRLFLPPGHKAALPSTSRP